MLTLDPKLSGPDCVLAGLDGTGIMGAITPFKGGVAYTSGDLVRIPFVVALVRGLLWGGAADEILTHGGTSGRRPWE